MIANLIKTILKMESDIIVCPVCNSLLHHERKISICENNHSFDHAKEGYLNLLLSNKKHSKNPGDSVEMITARRDFLASGAYEQLIPLLNSKTSKHLSDRDSCNVLDSGCGDGYFTRSIANFANKYRTSQQAMRNESEINYCDEMQVSAKKNHLCDSNSLNCYGVDISKPAIKVAAKMDNRTSYIIANAMLEMPFIDNSIDIILSILAPRNIEEFNRILTQDGMLLIGIPGEFHLMELRSLLMAENISFNEKSKNIVAKFAPKFTFKNIEEVNYKVTLSNEQLRNLIHMTPMYWKSTPSAINNALALESLTITVNFLLIELTKTH